MAMECLDELLDWLQSKTQSGGSAVGIFDATNTTKARTLLCSNDVVVMLGRKSHLSSLTAARSMISRATTRVPCRHGEKL